MSLFSRKRQPSLHQAHAAAHELAQDALSIFHAVADDLEQSADQHATVASVARDQAADLIDLADSAEIAASEAATRAQAVRDLVS